MRLCDKWGNATRDLTGKFWANGDEHPWKGGVYVDEYLSKLSKRIEQVGRLRNIHEELLKLVSPSDRKQLDIDGMFESFEEKAAELQRVQTISGKGRQAVRGEARPSGAPYQQQPESRSGP